MIKKHILEMLERERQRGGEAERRDRTVLEVGARCIAAHMHGMFLYHAVFKN